MDPRVEKYQAEYPDRNVWGNLNIGEIFTYLNQEPDAPTAKEVFDHYWSILEYALSDEEKSEIRAMTPEEGVKRLLALGGSVWNVYVTVDLLESYEYSLEDKLLSNHIEACEFYLPTCPIDILRAGVILNKDMSENVLDQHDFDFLRTVLVYEYGVLVDSLVVDINSHTVIVPIEGTSENQQLDQEVIKAEEEWARKHSLKWERTMVANLNLYLSE